MLLEDFDVVVAGGQIMLVAEENPVFTIGLALLVAKYGAKHLGGKAAAAVISIQFLALAQSSHDVEDYVLLQRHANQG